MKEELLKGCYQSLLGEDVQEIIEKAFCDPSTFTSEDKPEVEVIGCMDGRWRIR